MKRLAGILLFFVLALPEAAMTAAAEPRNLLVSVLQTTATDAVRALLSPQREAGDFSAGRTPATVYGSRRYPEKFSTRQLRVLEGQTAFIHVGQLQPEVQLLWVEAEGDNPLPHISFNSRERLSGFTVRAELAGEEVTLRVHHYDQSSRLTLGLATVITGRIGEWLDLGGSLVPAELPAGVTTYSVSNDHPGRSRIFVKVEPAE